MWFVPRDGARRQIPGILPPDRAWLGSFGWAAIFRRARRGSRAAFELLAPGLPAYPTFLVAVLFAALQQGAAAGLFAMALGAIGGAYFLMSPSLTPAHLTAASALYFATSLLVIWGAEHFRRRTARSILEEQRRDRHEQLIVNQNEILARIAAGAPLSEVFDKLVRTIEEFSDHTMLGSILLLDRDGIHLRLGAAPSLPQAYNDAIDGGTIGPAAGSCGTAAYRKEAVFVTDIEHDPLWADYRDFALSHNLRACWSTPITSRSSRVLGTFAIYYREPRSPSPDDLDIISYVSRTAALAIDRNQIETQREMLIKEMNHRVKNTLATVQSIASQTLRSDGQSKAYETFASRLSGLASAHDLLVRDHWDSVDIHDLIAQTVIKPFAAGLQRVSSGGPPVRLPPQMTLLMSLALHELCTNAAKYGALSNALGSISITWNTAKTAEGRNLLNLHWAETGGPPVQPPTRKGFGSRLIERALAMELGGVAAIDYRRDGVVCDISAPLSLEPA